jgi:DNA repair exonuclease SbcCD nuclease subunit
MKLKKGASFTDIHWGRRNDSIVHNQDCFDYITWFVDRVKADPDIDHINFLGDWFQVRSAINGLTMDYSYRAIKMLDSLNIPVFFIIGNHDLYFRNNRNIYNTLPFESLKNFHLVNDITPIKDVGPRGSVYSPFLFEHEFPKLLEYTQYPILHGHLEFAGFVITGDTIVKDHGPDHSQYKAFHKIFTGHYHKRQNRGNVHYIGSTHPMDYSDAGDIDRGMAVYDYDNDGLKYINWPACPSYTTCNLSQIIETPSLYLKSKGSVRAIVDTDIEHADLLVLKEKLFKKYDLREFYLEDDKEITLDGDTDTESMKHETIDNIIKSKLKTVTIEDIEPDLLVEIYDGLGKK